MKNISLVVIALLICETVQSQILTDSLIAYYPYNGNANDASGNGNHGTPVGATLAADRFGNPDAAYAFNGSNTSIEYTASQNFKPATFPVAVTAWIKANNNNVPGTIFKNDHNPDHYTGILFQTNPNGVIHIYFGDGGVSGEGYRRSKIGTINVNDNEWHFVAGVIRGPNDMDLYVDCQYDSLAYYSGGGGNLAYSNNGGITGMVDVVDDTYWFNGIIDDVRFYHRDLTQTDLQQLYSYPVPFDGLSVDLGADTMLSPATTMTINPAISGSVLSYNWSTGDTTQSISVNTPGVYVLSVNNSCSFASDTIVVTLKTGTREIHPFDHVSLRYVAESNSIRVSGIPFSNRHTTIQLFNAIGQVSASVFVKPFTSSFEMQLCDATADGVYFLRLNNPDVHRTLRFMKY